MASSSVGGGPEEKEEENAPSPKPDTVDENAATSSKPGKV